MQCIVGVYLFVYTNSILYRHLYVLDISQLKYRLSSNPHQYFE